MIVACVRTGTKYGPEYVTRLEAGVARHLQREHRFVCLTDRPQDLPGVWTHDIGPTHLKGWWGKMALFDFAARIGERVIYLDLDTVVVGDLTPLADLDCEFAICGSFTRAAGNLKWPCRYGSCIMSFAPGFGAEVWQQFTAAPAHHMVEAGIYGDQMIIERLLPAATILQEVLPPGYFLGYRDLGAAKPGPCALVIFAGNSKPHNCNEDWIRTAWAA
ncbi:MAG: hypothetical protein ABFD96_25455 [Armatimonadia bacterium]